jgi:geranylgeranyl reductase family protein
VLVLEGKSGLGLPVCCTGIIGWEGAQLFGLDDSLVLKKINSARLFSPSGRELKLYKEKPQAYVVDRARFIIALADRAKDMGVEYWLNSIVHDIRIEDDKVIVGLTRQGERLNLGARAVVIANGFGRKLNGSPGKFTDFIMGAQAEVTTTRLDEVEVYFGEKVAPGFFAWLVPTSSQRALVGLMSRNRPGYYLRKLISSLLSQGKLVSAEAKLIYGGIPLSPLTRTYCKRILVVGGAAGQVKPTTGGGIYYGLLAADIAADTLHRALEGHSLLARKLAEYQRKWRAKLGRELKIGYWARKFYERCSDRQIDQIFGILKSSGFDKALLNVAGSSFDWHGKVAFKLLNYGALSAVTKGREIPSPWGVGIKEWLNG